MGLSRKIDKIFPQIGGKTCILGYTFYFGVQFGFFVRLRFLGKIWIFDKKSPGQNLRHSQTEKSLNFRRKKNKNLKNSNLLEKNIKFRK